ncbi:hypothetical protein TcasGA2_TC034761 [Tribolium castaneum]|uniref:Chitin-binding type-2 domain-containing protein n=1 Tax=Tribolium castaneum TaxID=7070 RepID=A0A139WFU4_TRICA|nr:PREDICTED: uncharacterized protein LOC103313544 [Tribolium castaneum]KYB26843.1 hypothetical protein TcasGA2_TC034761 [Tribolium castaneum]|eukprot:XP_008195260.1 PREDICTED: uncharacterized protein LOC103313544 [Tribolium castaneum]
MYSISHFRPISLFLCVEISLGFVITSQSTEDLFPVQTPNRANPQTFFKNSELMWCPDGYNFDPKLLFCAKLEPTTIFEDLKPNPHNCSTFFNCNGIFCHLMNCSDHLIFNNARKVCDYPQEANCCEFEAKNPDVLIPPEFAQQQTYSQ